jgi:hypothetical protein
MEDGIPGRKRELKKWHPLAVFLFIALCALMFFVWKYCQKNSRYSKTVTSPKERVLSIYNSLDAEFPGRDPADSQGDSGMDIPNTYATILLAEVNRRRKNLLPEQSNLAFVAGEWLLRNSDLNGDGVIGWGRPNSWDAFSDGSINSAHTEYSISTGLVVQALLDWMDCFDDAPRGEILAVITSALRPYTHKENLTPTRMIPYSLQMSDRGYDVFNSAAYLAGQMQRFSRITTDVSFAQLLQKTADQTMMQILVQARHSSDSGSWYWNYFTGKPKKNDLVHAAFTVEGILSYIENGGNLKNEFDVDLIIQYFHEFYDYDSSQFMAHTEFNKGPARISGIGMLMRLTSKIPQLRFLQKPLLDTLPNYCTTEGRYAKYPIAFQEPPEIVKDYEAYLYAGLISILENPKNEKNGIVK